MNQLNIIYDCFKKATGVSTDTRKIEPGQIFFALKGPNFNANKMAKEALEKGASFAVIDDPDYKNDDRCLLVDDVLTTLQKLANHHRRQFNIPVLAITGSNGKTTTKELVQGVLAQKYNTLATSGNLNNHIGVPLTLLRLNETTEMAIVEMGANKIGDIKELTEIAEPTHGIITNIGKAHLEGFGGFEGVLRAKTELFDFLKNQKGTVFINTANPVLSNLTKRFAEPVLYPQKGDFLHVSLINANPVVVYQDENGEQVATQMTGKYNFDNIVTALCIGKYFEVEAEKANQAVSAYQPSNNRSQVIKKGSTTIYLDAYNANPTSMANALENFNELKAEKKVVILGDMYELGSESEAEHVELGKYACKLKFDLIIFIGKHVAASHQACPNSLYFESKEKFEENFTINDLNNSFILIKASRGMALETLTDKF